MDNQNQVGQNNTDKANPGEYKPEVLPLERFIIDSRNQNAQKLAEQLKELRFHQRLIDSGKDTVKRKDSQGKRVDVEVQQNIEMVKKNINHYLEYVEACDDILEGRHELSEFLENPEAMDYDEDAIHELK